MNAEGTGCGPAVEEYGTEMTAGWLATEAEITVLGIQISFLLWSSIPAASTLSVCEGEASVFVPKFLQINGF